MKLRYGRILATALIVEVLAVLVLVAAVAVFGPREPEAAAAYAQDLGYWLGPLAGFLLSVVGGWFVARKLDQDQILTGTAVGVAVALIDVLILVLGGAGFQMVFLISNIGKIIAGALGGWLAARSSAPSGP